MKNTTKKPYQPTRIEDLCHVTSQYPKQDLSHEQKCKIKQELITDFPHSALVKHRAGRRIDAIFCSQRVTVNQVVEFQSVVKILFEHILRNNIAATALTNNFPDAVEADNLLFYSKTVSKTTGECENICDMTICQSSELWIHERQLRITGYIFYEIYTYGERNPDRDRNILSILRRKWIGNSNTELGKKCEPIARQIYAAAYNCEVRMFGLVISPQAPWLAYSPDGVLFKNNVPSVLLEIKTVVMGEKMSATKLIATNNVPYVVVQGENIVLKKRHKYYGQVQFGMAVLNLKKM